MNDTPGQGQPADRADTGMDRGLMALVGMRMAEGTADRVVLTLDVTPDHHQPAGIVHGGLHCALIETAASYAASLWLGEEGTVVGVSNQTDFLRAVTQGRLTATATPIHRGRLQQLWVVEVTTDDGRTAARGQVRLQNLRADHFAGR